MRCGVIGCSPCVSVSAISATETHFTHSLALSHFNPKEEKISVHLSLKPPATLIASPYS